MTNIVPITSSVTAAAVTPSPKGKAEISLSEAGERIARMEAAVLSMSGMLREVLEVLGNQRITRTQERAIADAIHARARILAEREALPAAARRRVASEIRKTVRQATGCRAAGDIPARNFEKVLGIVNGWDMSGALRRIRREFQ